MSHAGAVLSGELIGKSLLVCMLLLLQYMPDVLLQIMWNSLGFLFFIFAFEECVTSLVAGTDLERNENLRGLDS